MDGGTIDELRKNFGGPFHQPLVRCPVQTYVFTKPDSIGEADAGPQRTRVTGRWPTSRESLPYQRAVTATGFEGAISKAIFSNNRDAADTSGESAFLVAVTAIEIPFFSRYADTPE